MCECFGLGLMSQVGFDRRFCVSLVAAVVGISFCVATSMSCSALLNFGFVRGVFAIFCAA